MLFKEQYLGTTLISENSVYQQFRSSVQHKMGANMVLLLCGSQQSSLSSCFSLHFLIYQHSSSVSDVFGGWHCRFVLLQFSHFVTQHLHCENIETNELKCFQSTFGPNANTLTWLSYGRLTQSSFCLLSHFQGISMIRKENYLLIKTIISCLLLWMAA